MLNFKLFGIPITVQPFFLLILAFIGGGFDLLQAPTQTVLFHVIVFMVAGFISILVHELGHALMMKKYGRYPEIILHGLGGVAISSGSAFTRKQNLLVTIMGPVAQIVLGLIAGAIYYVIGSDNFPSGQSEHFVISLAGVSIFWALANLIPVFPLDGGQILGAILGNHRRKMVHIVSIVTCGLIIAFIIFSGLISIFPIALIILAMLLFDNLKAIQN